MLRNLVLAFVAVASLAVASLVSGSSSPAAALDVSRCLRQAPNGSCLESGIVKGLQPGMKFVPAKDGYASCIRPSSDPHNCYEQSYGGGSVMVGPSAGYYAPAPVTPGQVVDTFLGLAR